VPTNDKKRDVLLDFLDIARQAAHRKEFFCEFGMAVSTQKQTKATNQQQ
jgi:hypothetical protein